MCICYQYRSPMLPSFMGDLKGKVLMMSDATPTSGISLELISSKGY